VSSVTKVRIRTKLSQLLVGIVIAPLFTFLPAIVVPTVLPAAQAVAVTAPCTTGSYTLEIVSNSVTGATNNSCVGALDLSVAPITEIKSGDLFKNTDITNIYFPKTLISISGYANFNGISAASLSLPCSLNFISGQVFQTDKDLLKSVQMCAEGTTASQDFNMGYYTFGANTGLVRFSLGATAASSVKVTTWNDAGNPTWASAPSSLWMQYCGSDTSMTSHLVTPYIPTGTRVQCAQPSGTSYAPQPPTNVSRTYASTSSVVSWTAPVSNGGSAITGYKVTSLPGRLTCVTTSTSCTVSGLTNGTSYKFVVVATNANGDSSPSIATDSLSTAAAPGAPTGVTATIGNTSSVVSWTAPGSTGSSTITGYTVSASPGGYVCTTTATSCTVSGLTNGATYTFSVIATNSELNSVASTPSASVTPRTVPGAPRLVSGTVADASSVVSWTAPASNGGSAITGYTVTSSPAVTAPASCTNTANLSCTFTGLTNGTTYTFSVYATNAAGNSSSTVGAQTRQAVSCKNNFGVDQTIAVTPIVFPNTLSSCYGTVTLGSGITRLNEGAFLTSAQLANQKSSPTFPADFNNNVTGIVFPTGFTTLDQFSLAGLGSISNLAFPNSLANIQDSVFRRSNIKTLDFSAFQGSYGSFTIGGGAFNYADLPLYWRDCTAGGAIPSSGYLFTYLTGRGKTTYCTPTNTKTLSALVPSVGTLSPAFTSNTFTYNLTVEVGVTTVNFTTTLTDAAASVAVNNIPQQNTTNRTFTGNAVNSVTGITVIPITVTAQDGNTQTYTVNLVNPPSNVATLSAASVKGQTATLGTPNAVLASVGAGAITLTTAQATGSDATTFTKTDAGATISKIVKYATGGNTSNFETDSPFTNSATTTVSNNDFFIIKVTAADASVRYYRINVTVNSNVATLSGASIKGQTATLGTPNATLGSETPGVITLTTAQATGPATSTFTQTDAGATISRIVKYAFGASTSNFDTTTALANGATTTITNGDFFIVKVTAADGITNYSRFNVTVNSDVATLSSASIKGVTPTLGTPNATLGSETAGAVTLTTAQATGTDPSSFTRTDSNSTISRIVKYATGSNTANFETDSAFTNSATTTVSTGDFFIIKVTAADASVRYYRINVTVNSNVATLSAASIKGVSATVGTAGSALGSLSPGTVTLMSSQATGTAVTTFTKSAASASITKIAKIASGTAENSTNFNAAAAFTDGSAGAVSTGDYFIVQITAADGTVNFTRINVVIATNPTAPLNLSATAQNGGANLTWNAPASNGGSAITGYSIQASTDSSTWNDVFTTNESTTQYSVTNLLNGTAYTYRVKANNSSGNSNFNWATSAAVTSFYFVTCSGGGSFYVNSTVSPVQIPSRAGVLCKGEVTIPQGIVQININAFTSSPETTNRDVTKINFPAIGLRTIDQGSLKGLGLTSVSIPATVETVGIYSFMNNYITQVFVAGTTDGFPAPSNSYHPTALLDSSFKGNEKNSDGSNNSGLALTLGSGKIEIGQNFGTGTVFSSVVWGTGLRSIGNKAFYNVAAGSWAPLFPATITSFAAQAFEGTGIKTIRFGTATTHPLNLTIATSAFDTSITSVQYCGSTGTTLSNYINSRFTTKTIWCAEVVPNAPTGVTAVPAASGQIVLNWSKGASLNEAPTDGFEIRYSSDAGLTWSALIQATGSATSITIPNLTNATSYVFQIRAKNLFGNSNYSASATGTPLGTQVNPTFGPSTSTADGFTVNVTNYDATYTYGVPQFTIGSGSILVGTPTGTNLPITVSGMTPGSVATFSISNQKSGFTNGLGLASGSALNAAKVPDIGSIVRLTGGFTAAVTNYDSAYQWNVSATVGTAIINSQGAITVSGVTPSTAVELTVNATRSTYAPGSTKTTVTTLALLKVFYEGTRSTGGAVPTDANSYASNSSAVVLANPASGGLTFSGYDFAGWSLNSNETGQIYQPGSSLALGLVNVTLYAKWTLTPYSVTYNANGATGGSVPLNSSTYTMGSSVPIAGNTGTLVRTGYSFIGWGLSSTDTVNLYVSGNTFTAGTNNIAFWARWSPNTYRVTFDANGGSGAPNKAYDDYTTAGTAITLATVGTMQKTGYNFTGWGLSAVSTPVADQFTTAASIDLYAQWTIANYAVTYLAGTNGSGTVPTQANVNYGSNFAAAASTGLTGSDGTNPYAFVSWSDGTSTYAPGQSILMGAGAITLTAQWTRIYNVKYSFNGGSVSTPIADQQKIAGDTIVVSSTVPTRAGYDFVTWKDQSGEEATAGANYVVRDSHYLLYAQWVAKSYTITYDVNGGNTSPTQANRTIGQIFTVAAAPSKIGHDFEHWSDGTNNYNAGSDYQVADRSVVLQAIWTPKVYQISYNFNGGTGTPIAAQNYTFGTGAANLPASGPTRQEFNFRGWSNSTTATTGVFTYEPSASILLHAVWVTSVYRLTFNAGSGVSDSATATVTIGQALSLPGATRTNYTLQGWSTSPTGGTLLLTTNPYTPTADTTLHAQWAPQVFTVTYNGNGGTAGKASDSVVYNAQTPFPLPSATRLNYVFSGWYSQASGGYLLGEAGTNYLPTGSIIAYAKWIQGSLNGMGPATLIAQITVRDGIDSGFSAGSNGSTATVAYTAGALPDGTVITAYLENSPARVTSLLRTAATPVLSLIIAWVAPDGTVPDTAPGKPIIMTVTNSSITAGSKIFGLVGNQPELLGIALVNGQVQVSITRDPAVVVAMVAPDAPTGVTATAINESSATISWTASASNGGSAIVKYVATAGAGKSCESVTTSCVINGLTAGTPYTFTVLANNAIGDSGASSPSAQLSLTAPPSAGGGSGGSGGAEPAPFVPAPIVTAPVITIPATDAKAAAEKAAADAKAAAELKAVQDKAAAEAAAAAAIKAAQEIADIQAKAAAELKAAQDKAAEELRIATELKAAQDKADAELKAAAEKKALDDAKAAAALAAKKIAPKVTLYSISSKLTLSTYDNAYLKKYISTLKTKAPVTCIGYYYSKNTTIAKAKALATTQAKAVCAMIKKAKPSVVTSIALYPATKAPLAAKGAKWVAVSYRVDSFNKK